MKVNKVISLMALASCVMLAGCGEKNEIVIKDMPTDFALGQKIDLDQYISYGSSKNYTVYPTEESASKVEINGHKINIVGDNEVNDVKLRIVAGDSEKEVSFNVLSSTRIELNNFIKDVGYDYAVFDWYGDSDGSLYMDGGYYHHKHYVSMDYFDSEDEGKTYIPGGFVKLFDGTYQFTFDEEGKPIVDAGLVSDKTLLGYNGELVIDSKNLAFTPYEDDSGNKYECLTWHEDDSSSLSYFLSQTALYYGYDEYGNYYAPDYVEFGFDDVDYEDGTKERHLFMYVYGKANGYGKSEFVQLNSIYPEKDIGTIEELDKYIAEGKKPEDIDFTSLASVLEDTFDGGNYTASFNYNWVDGSGNTISCPDLTDTVFLEGCEPFFPNDKVILAVNDTAAIKYQFDNSKEPEDTYLYAEGVFAKNEKVYDYERESATEANVYESDKYSSMNEVYKEKCYFMFDCSNEEYYPSDMFCYFEKDESTHESFYSYNITRYENLFKTILNYCPDLGNYSYPDKISSLKDLLDTFEELWDKDPAFLIDDFNLYNDFMSYTSFTEEKDSIKMTFIFGVYENAYYQIEVAISEIGTTEIPNDIASQFVVPTK